MSLKQARDGDAMVSTLHVTIIASNQALMNAPDSQMAHVNMPPTARDCRSRYCCVSHDCRSEYDNTHIPNHLAGLRLSAWAKPC